MHSLVEKFIVPLLTKQQRVRVCEIGASFGESTDQLLRVPRTTITVIDPCLDCDLREKYAETTNVTVRNGLSLDVLPELEGSFDCILIDGDHNWYTVYHELKAIHERNLLEPGGFVFFHDVDWPYGRRDMYYQPEMIPPEYRHGYARRGIVRGQSELSDHSAFNSGLWNATHEGGARNGVLTAVEDFRREHEREYSFFHVRGDFGLGIMQRRRAFVDSRVFIGLACNGFAYNVVGWPKRLGLARFPTLCLRVSSVVKKAGS
jgi:hypothetical protein